MIKLGYILEQPRQNFLDILNNSLIIPSTSFLGYSTYKCGTFDSDNYYVECLAGYILFIYKKKSPFSAKESMFMPNGVDKEIFISILKTMGFTVKCHRYSVIEDMRCPCNKKCKLQGSVIVKDLIPYIKNLKLLEKTGDIEIDEQVDNISFVVIFLY